MAAKVVPSFSLEDDSDAYDSLDVEGLYQGYQDPRPSENARPAPILVPRSSDPRREEILRMLPVLTTPAPMAPALHTPPTVSAMTGEVAVIHVSGTGPPVAYSSGNDSESSIPAPAPAPVRKSLLVKLLSGENLSGPALPEHGGNSDRNSSAMKPRSFTKGPSMRSLGAAVRESFTSKVKSEREGSSRREVSGRREPSFKREAASKRESSSRPGLRDRDSANASVASLIEGDEDPGATAGSVSSRQKAGSGGGLMRQITASRAAAAQKNRASAYANGTNGSASGSSSSLRQRGGAGVRGLGDDDEDELPPPLQPNRFEKPAMHWLTLTFLDEEVEHAFRKHVKSFIVPRVKVGLVLQVLYNLLFGILEYFLDYAGAATNIVLGMRLLKLVALLSFLLVLHKSKRVARKIDTATQLFYMGLSTAIVAHFAAASYYNAEEAEQWYPGDAAYVSSAVRPYAFFRGRWSLPTSLMFTVIVFHISGLRVVSAVSVVVFHLLSLVIVALAMFWNIPEEFFGGETAAMPIIALLSALCAHTLEKHMRDDFTLRCDIAQARRKRDVVLDSMLPPRVSQMLQNGHKAEEIVESFENVTILFGYITGFKELTTGSNPDELVSFVNSMFTNFDHGTDLHNVYKLEAIEASYLCCAGAPGKEEVGGAHADRCVEMAFTMLAIANHAILPGSNDPGTSYHAVKPELKIGIHTGPVVAGVSGVKSYSYHLYGDTVNTASRMGSTGAKCRVQISASTYAALTHKYKSKCVARGGVEVKGKGVMETYWLECTEEELAKKFSQFRQHRKQTQEYNPNLKESLVSTIRSTVETKQAVVASTVDNVRVKNLKFTLKGEKHEEDSKRLLIDGLEEDYRLRFNQDRSKHAQRMYLLVMVAVAVAMYVEYVTDVNDSVDGNNVDYYQLRLAFRFAAFLTAAVALTLSTREDFVKRMQLVGACSAAIFVTLVNTDLLFVHRYEMVSVNIIMLTTVSLLLDLRFPYVFGVILACTISYTVFMFIGSYHNIQNHVGFLALVYSSAYLGGYASCQRDLEFRYDFLHQLILSQNKGKSEQLLKNMLPDLRHVQCLLADKPVMDHLEDVTIMFSDLKGYTEWCSQHEPMEVYRVLNKVYTAFDRHIEHCGVYKLDTIGDAFVVVAGLDGYKSKDNHAMAMVQFAFRMMYELERIKAVDGLKFEMRIGIHTGAAIGSVIGQKKPRYLMWGKTPLIANELESQGTPGKVLVSRSTFRKLSKQELEDEGLSYKPAKIVSLRRGNTTEAITTYSIEMNSISALTELKNRIRTEQDALRASSGAASAPTSPKSTNSMNTSALSKLKNVLGKSKASTAASAPSSPNHSTHLSSRGDRKATDSPTAGGNNSSFNLKFDEYMDLEGGNLQAPLIVTKALLSSSGSSSNGNMGANGTSLLKMARKVSFINMLSRSNSSASNTASPAESPSARSSRVGSGSATTAAYSQQQLQQQQQLQAAQLSATTAGTASSRGSSSSNINIKEGLARSMSSVQGSAGYTAIAAAAVPPLPLQAAPPASALTAAVTAHAAALSSSSSSKPASRRNIDDRDLLAFDDSDDD